MHPRPFARKTSGNAPHRLLQALAAASLFLLPLVMPTAAASAAERLPFNIETLARFDEPWSLAFLPDGRMLVTERKGNIVLVDRDGNKTGLLRGVPDVDYGGQGGLGDIALHPRFDDNGLIYVSYAEAGVGDSRGAAVARGRFADIGRGRAVLRDVEVIWRQYPKVMGFGHYGHRLLFDEQGHLWIASGDRQKFTPAQDMQTNLGKVLRLHEDGSIPDDNPFVDLYSRDPLLDDIGVYPQIYSLGHRNPLGMDFDLRGNLWVIEMGPRGGDELNRIFAAANFGYPLVSDGDHYDGRDMPDHATRPEFAAPAIVWNPVISPGDLMIYKGDLFADWRGDAFAAGLSSQALVHIGISGTTAREVARYAMGQRIRAVVEGPDGAIYLLEDERRDSDGELLRLTPR